MGKWTTPGTINPHRQKVILNTGRRGSHRFALVYEMECTECGEVYIRELPCLMHGREGTVRDYAYSEGHEERKKQAREEGRLPIFPVSPEMFRERTPQELAELRNEQERRRGQRYQAMYEVLGIKVTASKDKTLEVRGAFGVRNVRLSSEPSATWEIGNGLGRTG